MIGFQVQKSAWSERQGTYSYSLNIWKFRPTEAHDFFAFSLKWYNLK